MRAAFSAAPVVLAAAIAWPAIAFGGVYPWAYFTLWALCAVFALCALVAGGWRVDALLTVCAVGVVAAVGLQLVPLAPATLHMVSPAAARFVAHQDVGYILGALSGPVWHPLSVNPAATWRFLAFFTALCGLFAGVASLRTTMSLRFVPATVIAVGAALALTAIIQAGAGTNLMYGVWAPETAAAVFGPFVNRNHFATWMLMALPVAIAQCAAQLTALAHSAGPRATVIELLGAPRAGAALVTAFACFLMSVALLATGSRSGFGGFFVIVVAGVWLHVRHRRSIRAAAPAAALVLGLTGAAVGWIGWRVIAARINELPGTRLSGRLDAWGEAWRVARDFWPSGSGLNTYATTMLAYHDPNVRDSFRTPHNDYLQALCDGGVLVGLPLLAMLGVIAIRIARRSASPLDSRSVEKWTRYGAAVGLTAVACQELVDFGLQTPANAVLFTVLAAYASCHDREAHRNVVRQQEPLPPTDSVRGSDTARDPEQPRLMVESRHGQLPGTLLLSIALTCTASRTFAQNTDPAASASMHLGPLALTPRVSLTNAGVDTNVFNAPSDESPKRDFTATVQPRVDFWMRLGRSRTSATVTSDFVYYQRFATERSVNSSYRVGLLVPLNRLALNGNVTYLNTRDRPGFEIDARSRRYELGYDGAVELRAFPKTFIGATASRVNIEFDRAAVFLGTSLHDELSRVATGGGVSVRYALTPLTNVTLDVSRKADRFPYSPLRDANSTQARIGVKFDPFASLRGSAVIGYRNFEPRSAGVPGYVGPTGNVDLSYVAWGATMLSVQAQWDVQYSFDIDQPYYVLTGRSASLSRLVYGQIDAVGRAGRQRLDYRDRVSAVLDVPNRTDYIHTYGGGLGYRLGRELRFGLNLDWAHRRSGVQGRSYNDLKIGTALTYGQ